ncbi:FMN-binding negative transcriptional regulator [Deinococcus sp. MIMF12]|uniref:FMN-binding negative transcriptional regulator n=1 Tax=Deinococcus rhizophilus TaxID=3049544 RepID=A0ABT7JI80_9DEIO|nr:FMN-binding negative transcriptional regulator [Deinococcus rhizophilus]MDL2344776.1 FMN-binding negative transcriptional regulator [Deinococcus rhizophilus]
MRNGPAAAECLLVFQGPQAYVTPSWYETNRDTGKVVPIWTYATVHVQGTPRLVEDAGWLACHLSLPTAAPGPGSIQCP